MKALLVNGSPRAKGCTYTALTELAKHWKMNIDKTMKVGAAVVSSRRGGNTATFDMLNKYFTISGMPIASSQYWNMVYGGTPEEVLEDKEGLQTMRTLGKNMAFLMKSIQMGKEKMGLPEKEPAVFTNFHNHS